MNNVIKSIASWLVGRLDELTTWIGLFGFILEPVLHRDPSTLMLVLFAMLVFIPDAQFSSIFTKWTAFVRDKHKDTFGG